MFKEVGKIPERHPIWHPDGQAMGRLPKIALHVLYQDLMILLKYFYIYSQTLVITLKMESVKR